MLLGGVTQIAVQWPALRQEGYRHQWILNPSDPRLRSVLVLMGPGTLGVAAAQINLLINTSLATAEPGAVSALGYAFRLMYMPIGIFGVSVATAAIPDLARQAATLTRTGKCATLISFGVRLMLMLSVPASVGLMVLAVPIVELIFQHGAFGPSDTQKVATALLFYAPAIAGYSIVKIAGPSFYSLQDSRTPVIVSLITIASNLVLNLWLNSIIGFRGLALGTAIAANINAGPVAHPARASHRRCGRLADRTVVRQDRRRVGAHGRRRALLGAVAARRSSRRRTPDTSRACRRAIGASLAMLALSAWVLRIHEFRAAVTRLVAARRKPRGPPPLDPEPRSLVDPPVPVVVPPAAVDVELLAHAVHSPLGQPVPDLLSEITRSLQVPAIAASRPPRCARFETPVPLEPTADRNAIAPTIRTNMRACSGKMNMNRISRYGKSSAQAISSPYTAPEAPTVTL